MSRFWGNSEKCPGCGISYKKFRCSTVKTYREAFEMLMDNSDNPADWRYKRRNTVLGAWHMVKQQEWEEHKVQCEAYADEQGDAWEPQGLKLSTPTDAPFG